MFPKNLDKESPQKEEIKRFDIALRIAGYKFPESELTLIVNLYKLIQESKDEATLKDVVVTIEETEKLPF